MDYCMQYSLITQQQSVATDATQSGRQPSIGKNSAAAQTNSLISAFCRKITPWALAGGTFLYNTAAAVAAPAMTKTITMATPTAYQFNQTTASGEDLLSQNGELAGLIIALSAGSVVGALGLYQCVKACARNNVEGIRHCQYDPVLAAGSGSPGSEGRVRYNAATSIVEISRAEPTPFTQQESRESDDAINLIRHHHEASESQNVVKFLPSSTASPVSSGTEFGQYNQTFKVDQLFSEIALSIKPLSGNTGNAQTITKLTLEIMNNSEGEKAAGKEGASTSNTTSSNSVIDQIRGFEPESPYTINVAEVGVDTPATKESGSLTPSIPTATDSLFLNLPV